MAVHIRLAKSSQRRALAPPRFAASDAKYRALGAKIMVDGSSGARALLSISESDAPLKKAEIATRCAISKEALEALLIAYRPLGLIDERPDQTVVGRSAKARYMLKSLAFSIEEELRLIDDWDRDGAECRESSRLLERGAFLLGAFEIRREELGSLRPTHEVLVSKAIIKAMDAENDPVFLMLQNQSSGRFQLIGGKARNDETPEQTLAREIVEELPDRLLRPSRDYVVTSVGAPEVTTFVSPTNGALTRYTVSYFNISLHTEPLLRPDHRWVKLSEIVAGRTSDGREVMPSPTESPGFAAMLAKAPLSLGLRPPAPAGPSAITAGNPGRSSLALTAGAALLVLTIGAVLMGLDYFSVNPVAAATGIVVVLLVAMSFVALGMGWIRSDQFVQLFETFSRGGGARPKRPAPRRGR